MASVRYEMSIISTFNGFRLQMLTSELVFSISVNRIVAEYLTHHVHSAPRLGVFCHCSPRMAGTVTQNIFPSLLRSYLDKNCLVIFYPEQKCSQVLRNFYFCLDSLFSLAIFGYLCIHFFPCETKAAICNDWICFGYFCRLLCSTRFNVRQTGHVSRVTEDLLVRFCSSKCLQRQ